MRLFRERSFGRIPGPAAPVMEELEPRTLLAGSAAPPPAEVVTIGTGTGLPKSFVWQDVDLDVVTASVSGKGVSADLDFSSGDGTLASIVLKGTDLTSSFSVKVTRYRNPDAPGDGRVAVDTVSGETGNESIGTLDIAGANVATEISFPNGVIKTLKVGDLGGEITLGGAATDRLALTAGNVSANLTFNGQVTALTASSWSDGTISACGVGKISMTGGDLGATLNVAAGGIGSITVRGGDLTGDLVTTGAIGNITVTGVATWDNMGQMGEEHGGNILSGQISTGLDKSIGAIALTGGGLGTPDAPIPVNGPDWTGNLGNITVKSIRYKASIDEVPILDQWGNQKVDSQGNPLYRYVPNYQQAGGGVSFDVDTAGKVGNITTCGGDLSGTIHAVKGFGAILVQGILLKKDGTYRGIPYTFDDTNIISADMAADLTAEPGAKATAITSITVIGGSVLGSAVVTGKIGNITANCYGAASGPGDIAAYGGGLESMEIQATAIGNITLTGGSLSATLTAKTTIGTIRVLGGTIEGDLWAEQAIGAVTCAVLTVDAGVDEKWYDKDSQMWIWSSHPGNATGGDIALGIHLGVSAEDGTLVNRAAKLGAVTSVGAAVILSGEVPFVIPADPAKMGVTSKKVKYTTDVTVDDFTGKVTTTTDTIGGDTPDISGLIQVLP